MHSLQSNEHIQNMTQISSIIIKIQGAYTNSKERNVNTRLSDKWIELFDGKSEKTPSYIIENYISH